jgi:hypothetical protein
MKWIKDGKKKYTLVKINGTIYRAYPLKGNQFLLKPLTIRSKQTKRAK